MLRISSEKMTRQIKSLRTNGIPFYYRSTNQRQEILSKVGNYMNKESQFNPKELNFIKQVKAHIIKEGLYNTIPNKFKKKSDKKKIKYYYYNPKFKNGDVVNFCYEIDLKSAYWETANQLGLLSEKTYEKGQSVSKKSRLASIGSLAKTVEIWYFDGKEDHELPPETSELTEFLWDTICYKVGSLLYRVAKACGKDFILFWVDAMFIHEKSVELVKREFAEAGYNFSVDKCKYIKFGKKTLEVKGKGHWVEVDGENFWTTTRTFPYKYKLTTSEIVNLNSAQ